MPASVDLFSNYGFSTILGGAGGSGTPLGSGDTSLLLPTGDGAKFPSPDANDPFMVQLGQTGNIGPPGPHELVKCTARSADTLTIVRGQELTTAQAFAVGTGVTQVLTNGNMVNLWKASPQVFNVRAFGAKGDGTTDDTTAIQNAITAAAAAGGTVYLPFGVYKITAMLQLGNGTTGGASTQNGIRVRGDGMFATTIKWGGAASGQMALVAGICQGNSFGDLTLLDG